MNQMTRVFKSMSGLYRKRPVACNVCMFGTMYATAEFSHQTILNQPKYDWASVGRMAVVGATFFGPYYYLWYRRLDMMLPGKSASTIVKKVVVDQCCAGVVSILVFFPYLSILEGKKDIFEELVDKGPKTYMVSAVFWPAVQSVNFFLLPPKLRTTFVSGMCLVWTCILAYVKSLKSGKEIF